MQSLWRSNDQWLHLRIFQVLLIESHFHYVDHVVWEMSKANKHHQISVHQKKKKLLRVCVW